MSATVASTASMARARVARPAALWQLCLTELRLSMRDKVSVIWGLAFPIVLLIIFGSIPSFHKPDASFGGYTTLDVYVPIVILFSAAFLAFIAMPMVLAGYRERGVLRRLQTTPAGPVRVLAAQLILNLVTSVLGAIVILVIARVFYGVLFPRQVAGFALVILLTVAALLAIGLFVAAIARTARVGQVIGALLFYPALFFSGLWFPIPLMAPALQHISHVTPLGAAWEALANAAVGHWPPALPLATLGAYVVVFGLAAARSFRWE